VSEKRMSLREVHIHALEMAAGILDADYELLVDSLVDGGMTRQDAERVRADFLAIADRLGERARRLRAKPSGPGM